MTKTMLIDATHIEETRVAVVDGNRLVEYDYESKVRKQLKGSIFLAKVTRVEPSLQAAFVNFGGNRHGFLPFSEIHPDYFRIPVADRDALLAAQMAELEEHDEEMEQQEAAIEEAAERGDLLEEGDESEEDEEEPIVEVGGEDQPLIDEEEGEVSAAAASSEENSDEDEGEDREEETSRAPIAMESRPDVLKGPVVEEDEEEGEFDSEAGEEEGVSASGEFEASESGEVAEGEEAPSEGGQRDQRRGGGRGRNNNRHRGRRGRNGGDNRRGGNDDRGVDTLGGDGIDSDRPFRFNLKRQYKIQEVIKRGQIMLIQVSKEERGNKGAAVTTYLSLPGRYCVLMPNSPRGGGVSRKIASFKDRKRMKDMLSDLAAPDGMSVILRTAGVTRTKVEIKRDLDYLTRLWNTIREHTLQSSAPSLIYEEGSLIKRAIRDLYSRDIEDVHVSGDEGYKAAKDFMRMLMPSHAKKVQEYKNNRVPMFHKFGVENQIADMGEPTVNLKSGGYLVINPTEALVSVDVNSGRATKERHIEDTALKTNLEAADEVARQLRLRDLGGLVVIDFIDMEDRRNNRKVEQRLRDALSSDRARIQVGRISSFGLLELSRQRLNPSLAEAQQEVCQHCAGTGRVRTLDFSAISIVRALEAEGIKGKATDITLTMATSVALYIMNNKRRLLNDIEQRYGFNVMIETDDTMSTSHYKLAAETRAISRAPEIIRGVQLAQDMPDEDASYEEEDDFEETSQSGGDEESSSAGRRAERSDRGEQDDDRGQKRRRGRRGGRGRGRRENRPDDNTGNPSFEPGEAEANSESADDSIGNTIPEERDVDGNSSGEKSDRPRRNRGRGRGRGRGENREGRESSPSEGAPSPQPRSHQRSENADSGHVREEKPAAEKPAQTFSSTRPAISNDQPATSAPKDYETVNQAPDKKKKGWWNRLVE